MALPLETNSTLIDVVTVHAEENVLPVPRACSHPRHPIDLKEE